jgi:inorganic pyrophosphatase
VGTVRFVQSLETSLHVPGDLGLIPQTLDDGGGPLNVLVTIGAPTFPGCVIQARPIGLFQIKSHDKTWAAILAVPASSDPALDDYQDISDVPPRFLQEIADFFAGFRSLGSDQAKPIGWENSARAKEHITHSVELYRAHNPNLLESQ